jgi:hypothetical protein
MLFGQIQGTRLARVIRFVRQEMIDPIDIQTRLNDLNSGLAERIGRDIGQYAVALLSVSGAGENEKLRFCGSGSLVTVEGVDYIMTARHVWEQFEGAAGIGVTLSEESVDHRFFMDMKLVAAFGPKQVSGWDRPRGPDMVLLGIPNQYLKKLKEAKRFYNLTADIPKPPNVDSLDVWILIGAPSEQGTMLPKHASLTINAIYAAIRSESTEEQLDYVDLDMDTTFPGIPRLFFGMSGGGFWIISIFGLSEREIQWIANLVGMACWQLPPLAKGTARVRCLGAKSIRSLISNVQHGSS